ncbi:hypothetical protein V8E55_004539 [Tylopilus felleus]
MSRHTHASGSTEQKPGRRHVVFIGETGSGKSSVINLIAGRNLAEVSPDVQPCTGNFAHYDVPLAIEGRPGMCRLWDTPGLNKASGLGRLFRRNTTVASVRRFLQERYRSGELDLLVFCVQGNRASNAIARAYDTFCRPTRRIAAPVVIAITHLERQQPTMEAWWQHNERGLVDLGLVFDGYACLTCESSHHRGWASREAICGLVSAQYPSRAGRSLHQRNI